MADKTNGSDHGIRHWDTPTGVPPNAELSSPDVLLASTSHITSCYWKTLSTLSSDHLPNFIRLQMKTRSTSNLCQPKEGQLGDRYRQEVEASLSKYSIPTDC